MINVRITYDTNQPSRMRRAYHIDMWTSQDEPHGLQSKGPVYNGMSTTVGVFASEPEATAAVLAYIPAPCQLVELRDVLSDERQYLVGELGPASAPIGWERRVLGRRTPTGVFVAGA